MSVLAQAIKALIVVAFLVVGFRLLGKREMAQLTVYDLAMLMALSNAVQNAMTAGKGSLTVGLATSSAVVLGAWVFSRLLIRRPSLERALTGTPVVLARHGQVLRGRLRQEHVSDSNLAAALRSHGLESARQAALVVLEVDGSLSVVPAAGD